MLIFVFLALLLFAECLLVLCSAVFLIQAIVAVIKRDETENSFCQNCCVLLGFWLLECFIVDIWDKSDVWKMNYTGTHKAIAVILMIAVILCVGNALIRALTGQNKKLFPAHIASLVFLVIAVAGCFVMRMDAFNIEQKMEVTYYDSRGYEDNNYDDREDEDVSLANVTKNTIFTITDEAVNIGTKVANNSSVAKTNVLTKYTGGVVNFGVCALIILVLVIVLLFLNIGSVRTFAAGICADSSHMIKQIVVSVLSVIILVAVYILLNHAYSGLEDTVSKFCTSAKEKYDSTYEADLSFDITMKFGFILMIVLQVAYVIGAVLQNILLGMAKQNVPQPEIGQNYSYYNNAGNNMNPGMNYGNNNVNPGMNYGNNNVNPGMNYGNNNVNPGMNYGNNNVNAGMNYENNDGCNETVQNPDAYAQQQYAEQTTAAAGEEVQKICPNCGMANNPENKFCKKCGSPLG